MGTKLVYGVGYNEGEYSTKINGKANKSYALWGSMLERCYSNKYQLKQPTYFGCSVSHNFKSYSYFHEWCQEQVGFGKDGYEMDKDLLLKGNKVYSEDTCVFIPRKLNSLLTKRGNDRGEFPIGVRFKKDYCLLNPYEAQCGDGFGNIVYLGVHSTPLEAFGVYKKYKENLIKQLAEQYKESIDERAYQALMNYEVDLND